MLTSSGSTLTDYLVIQNELPLPVVKRAIKLAHENGVKIAYNPSPMSTQILEWNLFSSIDFLIVNESELSALIGARIEVSSVTDIDDTILSTISSLHEKLKFTGTAVVTLGANGAVYSTPTSSPRYQSPYIPSSIVDTTGAGDSFLGAFIGATASGKTTEEAIKWASAAGCLAVQKKGAQDSIPFIDEARVLVEGE